MKTVKRIREEILNSERLKTIIEDYQRDIHTMDFEAEVKLEYIPPVVNISKNSEVTLFGEIKERQILSIDLGRNDLGRNDLGILQAEIRDISSSMLKKLLKYTQEFRDEFYFECVLNSYIEAYADDEEVAGDDE